MEYTSFIKDHLNSKFLKILFHICKIFDKNYKFILVGPVLITSFELFCHLFKSYLKDGCREKCW